MAVSHKEAFEVGLGEALAIDPGVTEEVARTPGSTTYWELNSGAAMTAEVAYQLIERLRNLYLDTATGSGLDRLAADRYFEARQSATAARAELEFTRATTTGELTIPLGTEVSSVDQSVVFATDEELKIPDTVAIGTVKATSTKLGSDQKAEADVLTRLVGGTLETGLTVTNPERSAGGNDRESDSDYKARVRGVFVNARRCTVSALEQGALTVDEVRVASAYEVRDSAGCPVGFVDLYVTDQNGDSNATMVAEVEEVIEEWRAAGVGVDVQGGVAVNRQIRVRVTFEAGTSSSAALLDVRRAIVARVNQLKARAETTVEEALASGRSVLTPGLVDYAVRTVPRVVGVTVELPAAAEVPEVGEVIRTTLGLVEAS
jgi:uncharacterized phage protein gp47/JayE